MFFKTTLEPRKTNKRVSGNRRALPRPTRMGSAHVAGNLSVPERLSSREHFPSRKHVPSRKHFRSENTVRPRIANIINSPVQISTIWNASLKLSSCSKGGYNNIQIGMALSDLFFPQLLQPSSINKKNGVVGRSRRMNKGMACVWREKNILKGMACV